MARKPVPRQSAEATPATPPTRARARDDWRELFLQALAESGVVKYACVAAGVHRATAYRARDEDRPFAAAWDEALDDGVDALELEARRRAKDGVERPVYQSGKLAGTVREYSDSLLMFLLRAHRPERFSERYRLEHSGKVDGLTLMQLHALAGEADEDTED